MCQLERFFHTPFRLPLGGQQLWLRLRQACTKGATSTYSLLDRGGGPSSPPTYPSAGAAGAGASSTAAALGWKNGEVFLAVTFFALLLCEGLYW